MSIIFLELWLIVVYTLFMNPLKNYDPTLIIKPYKGKLYKGQWPTVPEMVEISVDRVPERACFTDFEGTAAAKNTLTYSQVYKIVKDLAYWIMGQGIQKGDRIAVTGKNSPEWASVYLASLFAGAIICPLDYALHNSEQENLLATAKPKLFFVDEEKYPYYISKPQDFSVYSLSPKFADTYVYNLKAPQCQLSQVLLEDTATILFTSGTTGKPKAVMLSHKNLVSDAYIAQQNMKLYYTDVFYALLPIHHAYTMQAVFIEGLSVGSEIVFGKSMASSRMVRELKEGNVTMLLGVPLLFNKLASGIIKGIKGKGLLAYAFIRCLMSFSYFCRKVFHLNPGKKIFSSILEKAGISKVRIAICGGGPLAKSVFRFFNQMGINFVQGYGLTETSPIIALNPIEHFKIKSVGSYFAGHMEMKILNPNEEGIGEIAVKGPMVMQGYYQMEEETAKVFTPDGFFKTGDLGWLDKENYLMLSGRVKNMIVTEGGKNVYPEEIEDAFQLETDIAQITVQGYIANKDTRSEELEALVYPSDDFYAEIKMERSSPGASLIAKERMEHIVNKINRKLLPYQRITKVTLLESPLETTTTLKVKRKYHSS